MRFLEARGRGTRVGAMRVPAVPSAALFDLFVSTSGARPDAATGLAACEDARTEGVAEGRNGAGAGATVGKIAGIDRAVWGGVGTAHVVLPGGLVVSALAVVNAFGNVHDPDTGACLGGARDGAGGFLDAEAMVLEGFLAARARALAAAAGEDTSGGNTTIGVVVTNGRLDGGGCLRAAGQASLALADCVRPCLTALDGDTVFLAATGAVEAESHQVGLAGRRALARAVARAVVASNGPGAGLLPGGSP
jgi:L-aminopeptidase/D-esterase-like protein